MSSSTTTAAALTFSSVFGCILLGGATALRAQEIAATGRDEPAPVTLDELVISETPILDARRAFESDRIHDAATYTGTTRGDFEHRPNNRAGDVLERQRGVFRGGPPGERNDVRLHGLDNEYSRAPLDGRQSASSLRARSPRRPGGCLSPRPPSRARRS